MLNLFRVLARLPLRIAHAIGAALGWLTYWASPSYRSRFQAHARLAGVAPEAARRAVAAAGRMVAELPFLWLRAPSGPNGPRIDWDGQALIDAALQERRGIVFLTPHLGSFEITAQAYARDYGIRHGPITVLYRPPRKALLRRLIDGARERPGLATAPATLAGVRQMIRALRRGEAVGLLPDQVPPQGLGVWVPFFGQPAYTMTLAARLIQQSGATPLLVWGERLPRGTGYTIHVSRLGERLPETDPTQAESAAIINRAMEALILRCPQQYLWGYHRYKQPRTESPAASVGVRDEE
jgi:KDO2-lipid IV(A) lauroyltransferase